MDNLDLNSFLLRPVSKADADAILAFERGNKTYFEQWVPPRPADFFMPERQVELLSDLSKDPSGRFCVLQSPEGDIVGRINLNFVEVNGKPAVELGYRIAKKCVGQGLASFAVNQSLKWAKRDAKFWAVQAYACAENIASTRVLEKCGFAKIHNANRQAKLNGRDIELELFRRHL